MKKIENEWAMLDKHKWEYITLKSIPGIIIYQESREKLKIEGYSKAISRKIKDSIEDFIENENPPRINFMINLSDEFDTVTELKSLPYLDKKIKEWETLNQGKSIRVKLENDRMNFTGILAAQMKKIKTEIIDY